MLGEMLDALLAVADGKDLTHKKRAYLALARRVSKARYCLEFISCDEMFQYRGLRVSPHFSLRYGDRQMFTLHWYTEVFADYEVESRTRTEGVHEDCALFAAEKAREIMREFMKLSEEDIESNIARLEDWLQNFELREDDGNAK